MIGILFAQGSALLLAIQNILTKKLVKKEEPFVVIWYTILLSMVFLFPLAIIEGIPGIQSGFFLYLGLRVVLDAAALSLYFYALRDGDVSLVVPLSTFSVVFSLLSSSVINHEIPNIIGIVGIITVVIGTYVLNLPRERTGSHVFTPVQRLFSDPAARYILLSSFLYGIIFSVNKLGIEASSTSFFTFAAALGLLLAFTIILLVKNGLKHFQLANLLRFLPIGIMDGIKVFLFMAAVSSTFVAFVDASDNTTAVYATILAGMFLGEKIKEKLFPILIMIVGVVLITLSTYTG